MNIDDLTIALARQLAAMFGAMAPVTTAPKADPWAGRYVLVRCYSAGVHCGVLVSQDGDLVTLREARRLWSWTAKEGVALSGVAVHGLAAGKVDTQVAEVRLTGAIAVIPMNLHAEATVRSA